MRNIIEYTHGENDPDYQKLTSLLHYKNDTSEITIKDINDIYHRLFGTSGATPSDGDKVYQELRAVSDMFRNAAESINFENKIILSISIRLFAESFMINKINNELFVNGITKNQTFRLFDKYKAMFPEDTASIEILQRVLLMTPENIHLNSFMYEPILDMSDQHLRKLYTDVCSLDVEK